MKARLTAPMPENGGTPAVDHEVWFGFHDEKSVDGFQFRAGQLSPAQLIIASHFLMRVANRMIDSLEQAQPSRARNIEVVQSLEGAGSIVREMGATRRG